MFALVCSIENLKRVNWCAEQSILDCNAQKSEFYVKCGFEKKGMEMEMYFDEEAMKFGV
jgi:hypothetical protein